MQLEKAKETKQDMERCRLLAQRVGRRAVFLVVFQIGVDGHRLRFPRLAQRGESR